MKNNWWKILSFLLLVYTIVAGLLLDVPRLFILNESIRNLYFHVCMWFGMMILFIISFVYSIKYLRGFNLRNDIFAQNFAAVATFFGILGYSTGAIWANYTWITDQSQSLGSVLKEPKLIVAAIALLIYGAYFVLRGSFTDIDKRARISAVYNIFAFAMLFPSIWIIPRLVGSLHPGAPGSESGNGTSRMSRAIKIGTCNLASLGLALWAGAASEVMSGCHPNRALQAKARQHQARPCGARAPSVY